MSSTKSELKKTLRVIKHEERVMKKQRKNRRKLIVVGIDTSSSATALSAFYVRYKKKGKKCYVSHVRSKIIKPSKPKDGETVHDLNYKHNRIEDICAGVIGEIYDICNCVDLVYGHDSLKPARMDLMVVIEGYSMNSRGRVFDLAELTGNIKRSVRVINASNYTFRNHCIISPGTWKALIIGKGNAKKSMTMKGLFKKYGFDDDSEDINDSYAIGMAFIEIICGNTTTFAKKFVRAWSQNVFNVDENYFIKKRKVVTKQLKKLFKKKRV